MVVQENLDVPVYGVGVKVDENTAAALGVNSTDLKETVERAVIGPMLLPNPPKTRREYESIMVTVRGRAYKVTDVAQLTFLYEPLNFDLGDFELDPFPADTAPLIDSDRFFPPPEIILDDDPEPIGVFKPAPEEEPKQ